MDKWFVVGDVHGQLAMLTALLDEWNPATERLVLLGDLVDRGENALGVIQLAQSLHETTGAIILGGNHDQMLLDWLESPESRFYYAQGGVEAIDSFFKDPVVGHYPPSEIATALKRTRPKELAFLMALPDYHETDAYVFVHAGIDLTLTDWRDTPKEEFRWIREPFHQGQNLTDKTIIFGHTPTPHLNADRSFDPWVSPCRTKIGIDGGAVFGGQLHGLRLSPGELTEVVSVKSDLSVSKKELSLH